MLTSRVQSAIWSDVRFLLLGLLVLLGTVQLSWANLYNCSSFKSKPKKISESIKTELNFVTATPFIKSSKLNNENLKGKLPFLIYYAIDSSEAFMQYSVRYELGKLIETCKSNSNVNFVGLINSLYVKKNQILVCKNNKSSYVDIANYPSLNEKLNLKKKFIVLGDHTNDELGPMTYRELYFKEANKPFGKYPLAHPDFLYDLVNHVIKDKDLFPSDRYAPFLNLKSHGSEMNVLSGMYDCQSKAKELSAKKIVEAVLSKSELKLLSKLNTPDLIAKNSNQYEKIIRKLELGDSRGVGDFSNSDLGNERMGNERMGNERMSIEGSGLGNAFFGLGVNEGLGTEYAFGTAHVQLNWVLQDLFETGSQRTLGFLMLESCDTNRDPELFHSYLDNVLGYYSAKKSLWYRNLNWWSLLERAEGSSVKLVEILKEETPKIPNIEVVPVQ